jgi:hypothetical protein
MSRFLAVSSAVLRKDCRELWPQAAPTAAVVAIAMAALGTTWLNLVPALLITMLVVRIIQSDSSATVQHDWLTRPVPWTALLVAKAAFMFLWIALPFVLGRTVRGLIGGYSLGEAWLEGVQQSVPLAAMLGIIGVASAITASLWQALLILAGTWLFHEPALAFIIGRGVRIGGLDLIAFRFTGTAWVRDWSVGLLWIVMCALILWWQYGRRKTVQARTIYAGLVALALLVSALMLAPSRTFAIQRQLGPDAAAASRVVLELMPGCFASRLADASANTTQANGSLGLVMVPDSLLRFEGSDAVAFGTVLTEREPARNGHVILGRPTAKYVDAEGRTLFTLRGFGGASDSNMTGDGRPGLTHYWLLSRARYQELAARLDVSLQIDYSLSLLVPKTRVVVPVDGPREFHAGLGYCGARQSDGFGGVLVDCFKTGLQPALLLANEAGGAPSTDRSENGPDFTPVMLSPFAGQRYQISLGMQPSHVQITAYEARAHFERRITAPGVLGGTKEACPAPDVRTRLAK